MTKRYKGTVSINLYSFNLSEVSRVARGLPVTLEEKLCPEVRGCYVQFCEITREMCFVPPAPPTLQTKLEDRSERTCVILWQIGSICTRSEILSDD
nr:unnamed protein product [Callosobruchus chinensis]